MPIRIHDKTNKIYMITGCHLSATSFLANALQKVGIHMGNNFTKFTGSEKPIIDLNEKMLNIAGGSWDDPPSDENIAKLNFGDQIKNIIKGYKKHHKWGFKDSRFSLLWKHYLPYLKGDVYLFCCFRKPERIVNSSEKLNRKTVDRYNKATIELIKEFCEVTDD